MRSSSTFGVHFILRMNKEKDGIAPVYVRINVNGARVEMSLKKSVKITDWNTSKGLARSKNADLKILNNYLEEVKGLFSSYYREMVLAKKLVTPEALKNQFLGTQEQENTLQSLVEYHNLKMKAVLAYLTMRPTTALSFLSFML